MKKDLQRIANTLVLYSYHATDNGLFAGRTGIILFLYRYSQYAGNEYYSEFAGDLLDKVLKASESVPVDFENGLSGIGWTINCLLKEGLVNGDPNEVLQKVDHKVFDQIICNPEISLFGQAIYLRERRKDNLDNPYLEGQIDKILTICVSGLQIFGGRISLYHINSILSFLIEVGHIQKYAKEVETIRQLLPGVLMKIKDQTLFTTPDVLVFNQLLNCIETKLQSGWRQIQTHQLPCISSQTDPVELYIRTAWMQELYFGEVNIETPSTDQIKSFVDRKQASMTLDDFLFTKGLAGLGCALLSSKG